MVQDAALLLEPEELQFPEDLSVRPTWLAPFSIGPPTVLAFHWWQQLGNKPLAMLSLSCCNAACSSLCQSTWQVNGTNMVLAACIGLDTVCCTVCNLHVSESTFFALPNNA